MGIITLHTVKATMVPSTAPFRVVTDQSYISVVQQSLKGSLYVNRFRLLKTKSGTDQKTNIYTLSPAWEVRYTRSRKEDVPADKSDTQEYLDPDGLPFLEPSLELAMVDGVKDGEFDVVLLPVSGRATFAWQFFVLNRAASTVSLFNFPATDNGLFDVTGKKISNHQIQPDSSFSVTAPGSGTPLPPQGPPRAVVYIKHERVVQPDGSSIGVKRASRVMITLPVTNASALCTATIDSAVGNPGTIAKLSGPIAASIIQPAIFDLVFDGVSCLKLMPPTPGPNPLAVAGAYAMSFLIAPATMGDGLAVIGGDAGNDNTAAPFVRIVDGDKLEVGFGNGSSSVRCRTLHQVLFSGEWSSIKINYAGKGDNPFTMTVNGSLVPLTPCTTTAEPSGSPITLVGGATNGFIGALNSLTIAVGGNNAVVLPCNTVDYKVSPAQTPNTATSGVTAQVFGPRNEPSSSPVNVDMSGTFYIDDVGLTYYAGLAGFIKPQAPACLIDASDGLLHLYYQGDAGLFSVTQFSTAAARATFYANWTTKWGSNSVAERHAPDEFAQARYLVVPTDQWRRISATVLSAPDNTQAGFLNFVAHRVGTYMNATKITVASSAASPLLCDITVDASNDVGKEAWLGLPRNIDKLRLIWNGAGSNDPDAQDVLNQKTCYFDYSKSVPAVLAACIDDPDGCYFQFVSVPKQPIKVASVTVATGKTADFVDVDVEMTAPSNWQSADTIKQSWKNVPADPRSFLNVFAGKSGNYDYPGVTTPGTRAYGLEVTVARSDSGIGHVLLFVKDALSDFTITVADGATAQTCNVTICGVSLPNVDRNQNIFAEVINGQSQTYSYPSGYKTDIAAKVFALSDGLTAYVVNVSGTLKQGGAFSYAGLLRVLFIGDNYDSARIAPLAKTAASIFQSASLTFNQRTDQIRGSMMFAVEIVDPPTGGGTGKLSNTSSYSDGCAPLLTPGKNGGWMPVPPEFCVSLNSKNYIGFNVDKNFSPSNRLAISSDMTLQCWLNAKPPKDSLQARALTYNVVGNFDNPDLPIQYMLGSIRGPGLITATSTYITKSINFQPPNLTLQIYVKLSGSGSGGTLLTVNQIMGGSEYVSLSIDQYGKAVLKFLGGNALSSANPISTGVWVCLSATIADAGSGKVTLSLFVNAGAPVTSTAQNTFSGNLGALTVGGSGGKSIVASLNGVAFWQRALSATEVQNSAQYGFPDNDPMLGIRWNLAEGAGTTIANSAATGAEYNATVTNPASPSWDDKGAFDVPYVGRNDLIVASNRILKDWTNIALASRQGHGLKLDGTAKGTVKDGSPFNPNSAFSVEAWINPAALNTRQTIIDKPGSYSLSVNTLGQVVLSVTYSQPGDSYDAPPVISTKTISAPIPAGKTAYVVANFETGTTPNSTGSKEYVAQTYYIYCSLYVDGKKVKEDNPTNLTKAVTVENKTSSFFLGVSGDATFNFKGLISHVRVWSTTRDASEIARTFDLHLTPASLDGLIASWDFNEMSGTVAKDLTGANDLQLSSNQLWTIWQDVAQVNVYVNGRDSLPRRIPNQDGYQDTQFVIGGMLKSGALTLPYAGEADDVRLFSILLTEQQARESMNKALTGTEDHLAAYWRMDSGSGPTLFDTTGMGNNGTLLPASAPPVWKSSTAPIQNEGQWVVNALGGQADYFVADIAGQPSVVEYAAAETDAYGQIFSVMKRGYFYRAAAGETELEVGYKVGDLDTIFVGQVQSKPVVIGYIEGGPPIPSENQTLAYWFGSQGGPTGAYENACSVTYQESETKTWSYSANQSSTFNGSFNIKGGFYQKSKSAVSVGLGAEAETQMLETTIKLGVKTSLSGTIGDESRVDQRNASTINLTTSMTPAGTWEAADKIFNPVVGRRYIQNNVGNRARQIRDRRHVHDGVEGHADARRLHHRAEQDHSDRHQHHRFPDQPEICQERHARRQGRPDERPGLPARQ